MGKYLIKLDFCFNFWAYQQKTGKYGQQFLNSLTQNCALINRLWLCNQIFQSVPDLREKQDTENEKKIFEEEKRKYEALNREVLQLKKKKAAEVPTGKLSFQNCSSTFQPILSPHFTNC